MSRRFDFPMYSIISEKSVKTDIQQKTAINLRMNHTNVGVLKYITFISCTEILHLYI